MTAGTPDKSRSRPGRGRWAGVAAAALVLRLAGAAAAAPRYASPIGVVFAPDGRTAYVSGHGTDAVYAIDVPARTINR